MKLLIALIPTLFFYFAFLYVYKRKNQKFIYNLMLFISFLFGVISLYLVLFVDNLSSFDILISNLFVYFSYSAFVEESMKFICAATALFLINKYSDFPNSTFEIIMLSSFIGLGFGVAENLIYFNTEKDILDIINLAFLRTLFSLPSHIVYVTLNILSFKTNDKKYFFITFIITVLLHAGFNVSSTLVSENVIYFIPLITSIGIELYLFLKIFEEGSIYINDNFNMLKFIIYKRTKK